VRIVFDPNQVFRPTAIALGNFDGVHLGHQQVIAPITPASLQISLGDRYPQLTSTVVSFSPHPQEFFRKATRSLLAPFDEKVDLLKSLGVEQLVLLSFDSELAKLTAKEFIQKILIGYLQVEMISVGFDFHFGQLRQGNVTDLKNVWGDRLTIVPEQTMKFSNDSGQSLEQSLGQSSEQSRVRISSSNIRAALAQGDIDLANALLGRPYNLVGKVIRGKQLGRTIGFPTANLELPSQKCLPRDGVYAVTVIDRNCQSVINGVMNIGMRPTVNGDRRSVEVHLFDWQGDLYGQQISVNLIKFIRPEKKFDSLEMLKAQIQDDSLNALRLIK